MPKMNPKHRKTSNPPPQMGVKKRSEICSLMNCSSAVKQHIAKTNYEKYSDQLKWELKKSARKAKKIGLCKEHYKGYKKLQKKEEKYKQYRDFGPGNKPKKYKSHAFME
ncbi:MAG: hypothetical protein ACTSYU_10375 [Promethearchaeota archaeon]